MQASCKPNDERGPEPAFVNYTVRPSSRYSKMASSDSPCFSSTRRNFFNASTWI